VPSRQLTTNSVDDRDPDLKTTTFLSRFP
jgi:hypothetical protein